MNLHAWLPFSWRRRQLQRRITSGPLAEFLAAPLAARNTDYRNGRYLAVDFETDGLDPSTGQLLSAGWVAIDGEQINLSSAQHHVVHNRQPLNSQSVTIHHLTDDIVASGEPLEQVMQQLLQQLQGRILLVHHAAMDVTFLTAACHQLFGSAPPLQVIDTLALARRRLLRRNQPIASGSLRLAALREHYGLPRYRAHDALSDAIAAGELFLALAAESAGGGKLPLKNLMQHF